MSTGNADDVERWLESWAAVERVIPVGRRVTIRGLGEHVVIAVALWDDSFHLSYARPVFDHTDDGRIGVVDDLGNRYSYRGGGDGTGTPRAFGDAIYRPALDKRATALQLFFDPIPLGEAAPDLTDAPRIDIS
jgi:hypothetical protein